MALTWECCLRGVDSSGIDAGDVQDKLAELGSLQEFLKITPVLKEKCLLGLFPDNKVLVGYLVNEAEKVSK